MTIKRNDKQRLDTLMDELCEDIISMPDELVLREIEAEGLNIKEESKRVSDLISQTLGDTTSIYESVFDATKKALELIKDAHIPTILPSTAEERRDLLKNIMIGDHPIASDLTLAFRDITELSNDDIQGILEDLSELDTNISKI